MKTQNPTSMRNGVLIIIPWQPLGYGLYLWATFNITLLNYNKTKCNKKPLSEYCTGDKKKRLPVSAPLSNPKFMPHWR